jgi:hypothetical protein
VKKSQREPGQELSREIEKEKKKPRKEKNKVIGDGNK